MKRKFLILTLCFTIIFSSLNLKKSYALDFVISPTMLAVVSTLAVGTGVALKNADDIYDIGRLFFDYVHRNNEITWDAINATFLSGVSLMDNGLVSVDSSFLDIVKNFLSDITSYNDKRSVSDINYYGGLPVVSGRNSSEYTYFFPYLPTLPKDIVRNFSVVGSVISIGQYDFKVTKFNGYYSYYDIYYNGKCISTDNSFDYSSYIERYDLFGFGVMNNKISMFFKNADSSYTYNLFLSGTVITTYGGVSLPYNPGSFDWDSNVEDKKTGTGDLPLPIPGNLSDLLQKNPSDVWDENYENGLVGNGDLSIPNVDNPSISLDDTISFPSTDVNDPPSDIPDVNDPPIGGIIPPFPSFGDSLDFSPMYLTNINEKFPFSLPWDIGRLIEKFDVEPKAPIFKVPIVTSNIELDLTIFDEWANIVRFFILIGFALSLILISTKLLG